MAAAAGRDYAGPADLRAMQRLTRRAWSLDERHQVGGLAWQRFEHTGREAEWPTRLWEADGDVVAWGWIYERAPDLLYLQVDPARAELAAEVVAWFERVSGAADAVVDVASRQRSLIASLEERGYRAAREGPFGLLTARPLTRLPPLALPAGLTLRTMAEAGDPDRRAAAHRAAWSRIAGREAGPAGVSRVTGESYRAVMAAWPYRADLDLVLEAADGRWVANACIWFDEANGVGEFEPVGVDADFRRRGFGGAIMRAGLHALRSAGARTATVGARGDDDYPVPRRLYLGLGFTPYARTVAYTRRP